MLSGRCKIRVGLLLLLGRRGWLVLEYDLCGNAAGRVLSEGEDVVAGGDNAVQFIGYILQRVSLEYGVCRRHNKGTKTVKSMVLKLIVVI